MMQNKNTTLGHLACFVSYAIFGFNIIVCKDLASSHLISPITIFCLRSIGAGLLFWLISLFMPYEAIEKRDYIRIFAASILGFFLTQITFLFAISDITPMDCSIVSALSPIYTMFIAAIAIKEPITLRKAGGVILSFCGIIYLILHSTGTVGGVTETKPIGLILMILNSLCFSLYLGIFKPIIQKYSVITFMKWIFLFSLLLSLPFSGQELIQINYMALPKPVLFDLGFLILFATFISYFLIPFGQKRIRPTLVSMYSYVQPIIAIFLSVYIGMDTLSWQKVIATITVFSGVIIVSYSRSGKINKLPTE